jgi:endonuclease/exonuclease/phosphatase family metal-dependent hydrolase
MIRVLVLMLCLCVTPGFAGEPHRLVSYNIRFGSANDGPDRWEVRRDKVIETIRDLDGDVVGLQEAEAFQVRELLAALPRYAAVGVHRDDGRLAGEGAIVLYDRARYTLDRSGTFWLSDTPEVIASNTWDAAITRTCTWARLVDLQSGEAFSVYNTHWDHISQPAREGSALLISRRIAERPDGGRVIVMGDLNAGEDNPALRALLDGAAGPSGVGGWRLVDSYREIHPDGPGGTYTGFRVDSDGGARKIDHVLRGPGLRVLDAGIDRRKIGGRYPSDHFPVWAEVEVGGA